MNLPEWFTDRFIREGLGSHLKATQPPNLREPTRIFKGISTDTRTLQAGHLFVAIKGEKFDAHQFLDQAVQKGAAGILANENFSLPDSLLKSSAVQIFQVDDTIRAFRTLMASYRQRFQIPIIAVVGSVGKTTSKEMLAASLSGEGTKVLKTAESQNGFLGIALTLSQLRAHHTAAVIEVGIDAPGAMEQHLRIVDPTYVLITAIAPEHLEQLKTMETVAEEECRALSFVNQKGRWACVNLDDEWVQKNLIHLDPKFLIGFSLPAETSVSNEIKMNLVSSSLVGTRMSENSNELKLAGLGFEPCGIVYPPLPGIHNARNYLGAIATARLLGRDPKAIVEACAQNFTPAAHRSIVKTLESGPLVLCDFYNANPASVVAALATLQELKARHREYENGPTWACLGDMLELGPDELEFHRALAPQILQKKIDHVICYGPRMRALFESLQKESFSGVLFYCEHAEDVVQKLKAHLTPKSILLIKGSRGMAMEKIFSQL